MIQNYIESLAERTKTTIAVAEDDYHDKEGFLVCGKCHTRKEIEVSLPWGKIRPYCLCSCEKARQDKEREEQEEKQRRERIQRLRDNAFPDGSLADCTFGMASDPNNKLILAMQRYVDNFRQFREDGKGILLYGSVGTGKTFLAACTANELIDKGIPTLMTSVSYIANKLMGMFDGKNEYIETTRSLVVVTAPGPGSGKLATCLSQLYHEHKRGVKAGYAKFETFPIWNLPLKHPVNQAYEAATARKAERETNAPLLAEFKLIAENVKLLK